MHPSAPEAEKQLQQICAFLFVSIYLDMGMLLKTYSWLLLAKLHYPNTNYSNEPEADNPNGAELIKCKMQVLFSPTSRLALTGSNQGAGERKMERKRMAIIINYLVFMRTHACADVFVCCKCILLCPSAFESSFVVYAQKEVSIHTF